MTTIKDWCISRQLWWGHQIPAWFLPEGVSSWPRTERRHCSKPSRKARNTALSSKTCDATPTVSTHGSRHGCGRISLFNGILDPDKRGDKVLLTLPPTSLRLRTSYSSGCPHDHSRLRVPQRKSRSATYIHRHRTRQNSDAR